MGVINLGLLVDKIKRKLEGAGFIKNTDYASASKAGVVKIGSGVSVTSDGTISVSSQATLKIIDKDDISYSASAYQEIPFTLPADITKYHFVIISGRLWADAWDFGIIVPINTFLDNKRIGAVEMFSAQGSTKVISFNATNNNLRVSTPDAVSAGRLTVYLI